MRSFLYHTAAVEAVTPLWLEPGSEKERFSRILAASSEHYRHIPNDKEIRPMDIGGTWYPSPPPKDCDEDIVIYFYGGYTIGEGRPGDAAYAAKTLNRIAPYVLMPLYRLASNNGGQFPAALQDAVSAYAFVASMGIKPWRILLSGDSAGGHIAISLLRCMCTQETPLTQPRAVLL